MNLIWHIVKKDFLRLRLPLALWLVVTALQVLLGVVMTRGTEMSQWHFVELNTYRDTLYGAQLLLTFILAVWLSHEDAVMNMQAFWLTRPISRRQLLGAKLSAALLLLVAPTVILMLPWWLSCDFHGTVLFRAILTQAGLQAGIVLLAFGVAVFTMSWTQILIASFALIILGSAVQFLFSAGYNLRWSDGIVGILFLVRSGATPLPACAFFVLCALIVSQYLGRNLRQSVRVLGVGICGTLTAVLIWMSWMEAHARERELLWLRVPSFPEEKILMEIKSTELTRLHRPDGYFRRFQFSSYSEYPINSVHFDVSARGIPNFYIVSGVTQTRLHWLDGVDVTSRGSFGMTAESAALLREAAAKDLLGLPVSRPSATALEAAFRLSPSLAVKLTKQPPAWNTTITGQFLRPQVVMKLPLQIGAQAMDGTRRLQVRRIVADPNNPQKTYITFLQTQPANEPDPNDWHSYPYFARQPFNTMFIVGSDGSIRECGNVENGNNTTGDINGVQVRWYTFTWNPTEGGAVLYKLVYLPEKSFIAQFSGEKFPLDKVVVKPWE